MVWTVGLSDFIEAGYILHTALVSRARACDPPNWE